MWSACLATLALGAVACGGTRSEAQDRETASAEARASRSEPAYVHPVIDGHGRAVHLPDAAFQPREGGPYRVVFDITDAPEAPHEPHQSLDKVARFFNIFGAAGVPADEIDAVVVFHGDATATSLSDAAHRERLGRANPSAALMRQLEGVGVRMTVCGQSLAHEGYAHDEVAEDVEVAVAALTVLPMLANQGFHVQPL